MAGVDKARGVMLPILAISPSPICNRNPSSNSSGIARQRTAAETATIPAALSSSLPPPPSTVTPGGNPVFPPLGPRASSSTSSSYLETSPSRLSSTPPAVGDLTTATFRTSGRRPVESVTREEEDCNHSDADNGGGSGGGFGVGVGVVVDETPSASRGDIKREEHMAGKLRGIGVDGIGDGGGGYFGSDRAARGRGNGNNSEFMAFPAPPPAGTGLVVSTRWTLEPLHGGGGGGSFPHGRRRRHHSKGSETGETVNMSETVGVGEGVDISETVSAGETVGISESVGIGSSSVAGGDCGIGPVNYSGGGEEIGVGRAGEVGVGLVKRSMEISVGKLDLWSDPPVLGRISHLIRFGRFFSFCGE